MTRPLRTLLPVVVGLCAVALVLGLRSLRAPESDLSRSSTTMTPLAPQPAPANGNVLRPPDSVRRTTVPIGERLLPGALRTATLRTLGDFLQVLPEWDESTRAATFQAVLTDAMTEAPAAVLALLDTLSRKDLRELGVHFVLGRWAESDPTAALAWAAHHAGAEGDGARLRAAFEGFARTSPSRALAWMAAPERAADWDQLARVVVYHFQSSGRLADAQAGIKALPEGPLRDLLVLELARSWAVLSPGEAAPWLAEVGSDAAYRDGLRAIVQSWAATQPTDAAAFAQQLAGDPGSTPLLADVLYVWARADLAAASNWLRGQPAASVPDDAVARIIEATAAFDRVEAGHWLARVRDLDRRADLRRVFNLP